MRPSIRKIYFHSNDLYLNVRDVRARVAFELALAGRRSAARFGRCAELARKTAVEPAPAVAAAPAEAASSAAVAAGTMSSPATRLKSKQMRRRDASWQSGE